MTQSETDQTAAPSVATPYPALNRLERLVGTWQIRGGTPEAPDDTISGRVTIEWLPGGFFLQQRAEMAVGEFRVHSLEIVGYDHSTDTFPAYVFSSLGEAALRYWWNVQGDVVTHWTDGSKYTGAFSDDGNTLVGGWRPAEGREGPDNIAYDATMIRIS